jgi:acid stress-induced BolA-like protein IbaG/YrbA
VGRATDQCASVGGCGSFYAILVSSPAFKGLSTIKQHKLVNEVLKEDIKGIHGLQVGLAVAPCSLLPAPCSLSLAPRTASSVCGRFGFAAKMRHQFR